MERRAKRAIKADYMELCVVRGPTCFAIPSLQYMAKI